MFRRSFMNEFKVRKYARYSAFPLTVSSNISILGSGTIKIQRMLVIFLTSMIFVSATGSFELFYEIVTHPKPAYHKTLYEKSIPAEVREPNTEIIENYKTINEMKQFLKIYDL